MNITDMYAIYGYIILYIYIIIKKIVALPRKHFSFDATKVSENAFNEFT